MTIKLGSLVSKEGSAGRRQSGRGHLALMPTHLLACPNQALAAVTLVPRGSTQRGQVTLVPRGSTQ